MGTPDFAVPSLDILNRNNYEVCCVVTAPDKPKGRGLKPGYSAVKEYALTNNFKILQPENLRDDNFRGDILELNPDLIIVVAFRILPEKIYNIPSKGAFNLHASLLPKFRGAAPINYAIINGEKETGVTTFFLNKTVDTGEIIAQRKVEIGNKDFGELYNELKFLGAELVLETVKMIESGKLELKKQNDEEASPAPKIFKNDCRINWNDSDVNIYNKIRGLSPVPCAFTTFQEKIIKIYKTELTEIQSEKDAGEVEIINNELYVNTKSKKLKIIELQKEGRKRITATEFITGIQNKNIKFI